ncbi:YlzJ-like protein [Lentibacillus halodurans]|uniref:YlzJ-like protein n=1 Tax=Lentibacillus halodurans TaxID=237679 RepID=A0A1I0VJW2_9BACI|nr:YlzJ-like family protein [Lentibacillus halodurans]SFA76685.1 YlzJ-like protein [Lentibacillus halodurans]
MILYTPLSETDIFPSADQDFQKRHCVSYNGKQMYVEEMEDGQFQVLQLLSTDPHDFMNVDYTPGTILR